MYILYLGLIGFFLFSLTMEYFFQKQNLTEKSNVQWVRVGFYLKEIEKLEFASAVLILIHENMKTTFLTNAFQILHDSIIVNEKQPCMCKQMIKQELRPRGRSHRFSLDLSHKGHSLQNGRWWHKPSQHGVKAPIYWMLTICIHVPP